MISITVNNKEYSTTQTSLPQFLQEIGFANTTELAIAVNDEIIPKSNIENYKLSDNDKLTIIRITCGG